MTQICESKSFLASCFIGGHTHKKRKKGLTPNTGKCPKTTTGILHPKIRAASSQCQRSKCSHLTSNQRQPGQAKQQGYLHGSPIKPRRPTDVETRVALKTSPEKKRCTLSPLQTDANKQAGCMHGPRSTTNALCFLFGLCFFLLLLPVPTTASFCCKTILGRWPARSFVIDFRRRGTSAGRARTTFAREPSRR